MDRYSPKGNQTDNLKGIGKWKRTIALLLANEQRKEEEMMKKTLAIGVPIVIRYVTPWENFISNEKMGLLTPSIIRQIKVIKRNFAKHYPDKIIKKIEYVVNDTLHQMFEETKRRFLRSGRSTHERVLFHGTAPENINRYEILHILTFSHC